MDGIRRAAASLLLTCIVAGAADGQSYTIHDLGVQTWPRAINENGLIVGQMPQSGPGVPRPVLWEHFQMTDLGDLGGNEGIAHGVNDVRQIAGWANNSVFDTRAVVWEGGSITDLGTLGGTDSRAFGISSSGLVTGWARTSAGFDHAFLHDGTSMTDLGAFVFDSEGRGVNSAAKVVGFAGVVGLGDDHAFEWTGGPLIDIGGLPGFTDSFAEAVNELGQIVGRSTIAGATCCRATLWDGGTIVDLGFFDIDHGIAYGINDRTEIVGTVSGRAFLWRDGRLMDLNDVLPAGSLWDLEEATDINEFGEIVGFGELGGVTHGFHLAPLPYLSTSKTLAPGDDLEILLEGAPFERFCLALAPDVGPVDVPGLGLTLDVGPDLGSVVVFASASLPHDGVGEISIQTPSDPALVSTVHYWQAYTFDGQVIGKSNRSETVFE